MMRKKASMAGLKALTPDQIITSLMTQMGVTKGNQLSRDGLVNILSSACDTYLEEVLDMSQRETVKSEIRALTESDDAKADEIKLKEQELDTLINTEEITFKRQICDAISGYYKTNRQQFNSEPQGSRDDINVEKVSRMCSFSVPKVESKYGEDRIIQCKQRLLISIFDFCRSASQCSG